MLARDMTRDQLAELLAQHGSAREVAKHLGQPPTTVGDAYRRLGLVAGPQRPSAPRPARKGCLTRDHLTAALLPPNNCHVMRFLEGLDEDQRELVEEALGYDRQDLSASRLRQLLIESGYDEKGLPGVDAINAHRSGTRPCRCKG